MVQKYDATYTSLCRALKNWVFFCLKTHFLGKPYSELGQLSVEQKTIGQLSVQQKRKKLTKIFGSNVFGQMSLGQMSLSLLGLTASGFFLAVDRRLVLSVGIKCLWKYRNRNLSKKCCFLFIFANYQSDLKYLENPFRPQFSGHRLILMLKKPGKSVCFEFFERTRRQDATPQVSIEFHHIQHRSTKNFINKFMTSLII